MTNNFLKLVLLFVALTGTIAAIAQQQPNYQALADSLYEAKNYKLAIETYTKAIEVNNADKLKTAVLLDKRAQVLNELDDYKKAIADETEAIALDPTKDDFYWNRAIAYSSIQEFKLAIFDYDKAIALNPNKNENLSTLYDNKGINERKLGNFKNAINDHTKAIDLNKKNGDAYWHRAIVYNLNKQYQLAIADYSTAMFYNFDPEDLATLYDNRGNNKVLLKQYREAIKDFNTAISINSTRDKLYRDRALAYQYNSDYQLAIDDFNTSMKYSKSTDDKALLYNDLAINQMALHKPDDALNAISKAIELNAQNGYFYFTRGGIYSQLGKCNQAVEDMTKAMSFYKGNNKILAILHNSNAVNLYTINENKKVVNECNAAISLNPNLAGPYFTRGKVYLKRIINKDQAIKDFNKVIELDTTKSTVSYIFSQFYVGHTEEAMQKLQEQVLKTSSSDDVLNHYYNIACMYSIMNKPSEANVYLRKAIESGYSKAFAANDEDFDNIRKSPEYVSLMNINLSQK